MRVHLSPFLLLGLVVLGCKKEEPTAPNSENPDLPSKVTISMLDTSKTEAYIITWGRSAQSVSYTLQEDEQPSFPTNNVAYSGPDTTTRIDRKPFGKVFYYRVRGNNNSGSGTWSDTKSILVLQLPAPHLVPLLLQLSYDTVVVDSQRARTLTLSNKGTATLEVTKILINNSSYTSGATVPKSIPRDNSYSFPVVFRPRSAGPHDGFITIESNDPDDYPVVITAKGVGAQALPRISLATDSIYLEKHVSTNSASSWIRIRSAGNVPLSITNVTYGNLPMVLEGSLPKTILNGKQDSLRIDLVGSAPTVSVGQIAITSTDPVTPTLSVKAAGVVYEEVYLCASNGGGVFRSMNSGQNWMASNNGMSGAPLFVNSLCVTSRRNLLAGADNGVFKSTNVGLTWAKMSTGITANIIYQVVTTSSGKILAATQDGVFESSNEAASWSLQKGSQNYGQLECIASSPTGNLYAGGPNGILRSSDGGLLWLQAQGGVSVSSISSDASGTVYVGTGSVGLLHSTDGGVYWNQIQTLPGLSCGAVAVAPDGSLFASTGSGSQSSAKTWRSTDKGVSWNATVLPYSSSFAFTRSGTMLSGVQSALEGGVWLSTDWGATSSSASTGLSAVYKMINDVCVWR